MKQEIPVMFGENEWGQILDGLRCRAELYEETGRYYESGYAEQEIADVKDEAEAQAIAQEYRRLIAKIEKALASGINA